VFKDWSNALILPVPKNGDLQFCNNWQGISLFDRFLIGSFAGDS